MNNLQGRNGRPVNVVTNSFEIKRLPMRQFHHYDAIIKQDPAKGDAPLPPGRRYREIIETMQNSYPKVFTPRASYDGNKNMYSTARIPSGNFTVKMSPNPNSNRGVYEVRMSLVSTIQPSDLQRLITHEGADVLGAPTANLNTVAVNLLQVIVSQGPHIAFNFSLHAKSFYTERGARDLSGGLVAWKGFFQSVRPVLGRFIVNVDTTTAAFYKPIELLSCAMEVLGLRNTRPLLHIGEDKQKVDKLRRFLKGVAVYVKPTNRKKIIKDIVIEAGYQEFPKDGKSITVEAHYLASHGIVLKYPEAFGVKFGGDAIFPAEVCKIVEGQRYKRKLSPEDTTKFMQQSVSKPAERMRAIGEAVRGMPLNYGTSSWMQEAGLEVSADPITLAGRELVAPRVRYGSGSLNVSRGAWNVVNQKLSAPARIRAWGAVVFDASPNFQQKVESFLAAVTNNMRRLEIDREPIKELGNPYDVHASLNNAARRALEGIQPPKGPDGKYLKIKPTFIIAVLPRDAPDIRKQVKQWGDIVYGVPTQCVRAGKYDDQRGQDQYCNNIALKINIKAGGVNSQVETAPQTALNAILENCMIVGCDVSHPAPGITHRPSIASLVASYDPGATKYRTYIDAQLPRQEVIDRIDEMLKAAIENYQARHEGVLPQTIVIYRDGVSEGEFWRINESEIAKIDAMLQVFNPKPSLVFIVVGKRHHVRFFPSDRSQGDKNGNCNPGLVVDKGIVHSKLMDFYLQSHSGIIGTSRPSHYIVLKNGPQWSADLLQELSYALCFVYAIATRSVSIPAPVYCA
ncbi:hypothetical protein PHLCEN_2v2209 [Hermanssonia centrifuga]|uniref:Piwi-domain-containing protein n=1 Tax=Hermanssonia centrifuga TaxID=98765 RepID=A0A2R6RPS7_9APHY|nr:hypothetical protein PHLCEN_2v2209 [Hermanssonia centrifuga]